MFFGFGKLDKREQKVLWIFTGVFIVFYVLRLCTVPALQCSPDSREYMFTAKAVRDGSYFMKQADAAGAAQITRRPFLYPLFLALFLNLPVNVILLIQTIFGIVNFYLLIQFNKKINGRFCNGLYFFILLTPSVFIYTQLIMTEWLVFTFLMLLALLLLLPWSKGRFWIIQILTVVCAFVKPAFYPFVLFNLIYFSVYFIVKKKFSVALFLPVICLTAYMRFNEYRTGVWHFSSIQNINLTEWNIYLYKRAHYGIDSADKWRNELDSNAYAFKNFKEINAYFGSAAKKEIGGNVVGYAFFHCSTAVLRAVFDPGRYDLFTFTSAIDEKHGFSLLKGKNPLKNIIESGYAGIYILLFFIGVVQALKMILCGRYIYIQRKKIGWFNFYLFIVSVGYIILTGPVNCARYMMPLQGIIIVLAVGGLQGITTKIKR